MKSFIKLFIPIFALPLCLALAAPVSEVEQMKSDLMGKTMGGREKGWKFQSPSQIKSLVINKKTESAQQRVYVITLKLQDERVPGVYQAEAVVTYEKKESTWAIKVVGLKSFVKLE